MSRSIADHRTLKTIAIWASAMVGILLLYVLLLGPAVRLHRSASKPVQTVIEYVFAPLDLVYEHFRPLRTYVDLWQPKLIDPSLPSLPSPR